jgi:hypothetical protein
MQRKGWVRVALVILVTLGVIYAVKLTSHGLATRRALETERELSTEVAQMDGEIQALETGVVRSGSPEQIERWARESQDQARPGDHPIGIVTVVPTGTVAPPPPATPAASGWRRLVDWLSGGGGQ